VHGALPLALPNRLPAKPRSVPPGVITARTVNLATGASAAATALPLPSSPHPVHGPAPSVRAAFPAAKGGGPGLVVWSDHTLSLTNGSQIAWSREEALASVVSTLFIDLPAAKGSAGNGGGGGGTAAAAPPQERGAAPEALRQWVRLQVLAVLVQFKLASEADQSEFLRLREALKWAAAGAAGGGAAA
jgi:hypothetical protein